MFKLNSPPDSEITVNGREYVLDMAFDNVMDAKEALLNKSLTILDRYDLFLTLMFGEEQASTLNLEPLEAVELTDYLLKNFIDSDEEGQAVVYDLEGNPMPSPSDDTEDNASFSLTYDAPYVYGAFWQAYGINLHDYFGKLHWHQFLALLKALPDDTALKQILSIRSTPLSGLKGEELEQMRRLKNKYRLPDQDEIGEEEDDE